MRIMGVHSTGPAVKNHISSEMVRELICNVPNCVPFVVPGLSASSSSTAPAPTSPSSSSQDSVFDVNRYTENPIPERSGSTIEELRGDPQTIKMRNAKKHKEIYRMDCLVGYRNSEIIWSIKVRQQSLGDTQSKQVKTLPSHLKKNPMEPRAKVEPGSGKHRVYTHFPKDPNCDICLKTKNTNASCRRRTGTVVPRAEHFGDLITADHKVLSEESESRNNHRHAVVVQDLATQWIQSYPCNTKTSKETQKSLVKFLEPTRKPKVIYTDNSLEFWQVLRGIVLESSYVNTTQIRNKWDCRKSSAQSEKGTSAVLLDAVWSEQTNGGRILWMLLLSAKH